MSTGLLALLDDVALIARIAATSLDDVAAASMKATSKSLGVVIDDASVFISEDEEYEEGDYLYQTTRTKSLLNSDVVIWFNHEIRCFSL